jgi:hypothetical protein
VKVRVGALALGAALLATGATWVAQVPGQGMATTPASTWRAIAPGEDGRGSRPAGLFGAHAPQAEATVPAAAPTAAPLTAAPPATPIHAPAPKPAAPPVPTGPRQNWVEVPSVGVSVAVGIYSDCTGQTPLTRATAARDTCVPATEVFLVGHRPGVFAALPGMPANAAVNYWDDAGVLHAYRIYQVSKIPSAQGGDVMTNQHPALLMQTCDDPTGSYYYFYGAPA